MSKHFIHAEIEIWIQRVFFGNQEYIVCSQMWSRDWLASIWSFFKTVLVHFFLANKKKQWSWSFEGVDIS